MAGKWEQKVDEAREAKLWRDADSGPWFVEDQVALDAAMAQSEKEATDEMEWEETESIKDWQKRIGGEGQE